MVVLDSTETAFKFEQQQKKKKKITVKDSTAFKEK